MKINMTLKGFRIVNGAFLIALLFTAGNYYLEWGFFGGAAKSLPVGIVLLFILFMAFVPPNVEREMDAEHEAQIDRENEWERTRDKSNDEAEAEKMRRAIGMPPNKSLERTRDR